jgi:hypothetical protein
MEVTGTVTWRSRAIPFASTSGTRLLGGKALAEAVNLDWSTAYRRIKGRRLMRILDVRGAMQLTVMVPAYELVDVFGAEVEELVALVRLLTNDGGVSEALETLTKQIAALRSDLEARTPAEPAQLMSISQYFTLRGIPASEQEVAFNLGREATRFSRAANLPIGEESVGQHGKRRTYTVQALKAAYQAIFGVDLEEDATQ